MDGTNSGHDGRRGRRCESHHSTIVCAATVLDVGTHIIGSIRLKISHFHGIGIIICVACCMTTSRTINDRRIVGAAPTNTTRGNRCVAIVGSQTTPAHSIEARDISDFNGGYLWKRRVWHSIVTTIPRNIITESAVGTHIIGCVWNKVSHCTVIGAWRSAALNPTVIIIVGRSGVGSTINDTTCIHIAVSTISSTNLDSHAIGCDVVHTNQTYGLSPNAVSEGHQQHKKGKNGPCFTCFFAIHFTLFY